ncbi:MULTISPECIES: thioether cross-link-forming SCIFF peptide maturase [Clostridium]|uniref:thioether cross-link-forming SCIFF peptide maturase n=1 Tax=Clostridium TaxID=1485 RepID=UPI000300BA56|nr:MULTISPECIES: thioether cross-link-forming SCIFF peptide maturase [Clostridium]KEH87249.1 radical SAM protein [Clostridium novyi A str. BKT29909]KEH88387.1 radical SAM protein [Clostridium novyi A str. NCTC 538]KEH88730.1 radical SAM protein [Clostridium novyi A str. 4540]KEH94354.1 radical SAM protein [Clostridium botulinum C/D str. It1]KEH95051.1 radical SAM protein [Clostridium novyi A str. GD211209]
MALIHKFIQDGQYFVLDVNTGAVHIVDELVYDLLDDEALKSQEELIKEFKNKYSEEEIKEVYSEIVELKKEGYLYSEDTYEEIARNSMKSKDFIKALCLNVTHDCNLRCKYCFADEGKYHGARKVMSPEVGKKAIDFVIAHSGPRKNIEVDLFGGEPLIAIKEIKEIIAYAREQEKIHNKVIRFTMTTNALLLNDEIMEYMDKEMGNIVLSIDGRKEVNDNTRIRVNGSGTYDAILPKIKEMVDKRDKSKQYYVRGTFTRDNTDFYYDVKHLADLGFEEVSVEPVVLPDEHELSLREEDLPTIFENYDLLYKDMLKRYEENREFKFYHFNIDLQGGPCVYKRISGCGAGHEYIAVTPDGEIYPCHQFVGNEDFKIGTIYDEDEKLNFDIAKQFKEAHIYNKPQCRDCWAKFYCSGGCQANNYNFNGDIHKPYEIGCKMQKKRIECAIALKATKMDK